MDVSGIRRRESTGGRGTVGKTPVVGIRERGGKVKAIPVKNADTPTLLDFVGSHVKLGSTVYTDGASVL